MKTKEVGPIRDFLSEVKCRISHLHYYNFMNNLTGFKEISIVLPTILTKRYGHTAHTFSRLMSNVIF